MAARKERPSEPKALTVPGSTGRPRYYNEDIAQEVLDRIAEGETLIEICRDDHMPASSTIRGWDFDNLMGFTARYARAREMQIEHELDNLRILSKEQQIGAVVTIKEVVDPKTGAVNTLREERFSDAVDARRLEIDTLKWRIGKLAWRKYGTPPGKEADAPEEEATVTVTITGGLPDA